MPHIRETKRPIALEDVVDTRVFLISEKKESVKNVSKDKSDMSAGQFIHYCASKRIARINKPTDAPLKISRDDVRSQDQGKISAPDSRSKKIKCIESKPPGVVHGSKKDDIKIVDDKSEQRINEIKHRETKPDNTLHSFSDCKDGERKSKCPKTIHEKNSSINNGKDLKRKVPNFPSIMNESRCIEILDDSDSDMKYEKNTKDSSTNIPTPQNHIIEIDDESDSDQDDDIVFIKTSNQIKSNLERQIKAASKKRDQMLHRKFHHQRATFNIPSKVPLNHCYDPALNAERSKKHDISFMKTGIGRGKFTNVIMQAENLLKEQQDKLLRESAKRVKACEEKKRYKLEKTRKDNLSNNQHQFESVIDDVKSLPNDHWRSTCPFSRLGCPPTSSYNDVKKNYRKLSLIYHPDKAKYKDASDRFHAIKDAYETITEKNGM